MTKSEKSFSDCIKDSYEKALAPHHPWLVRKGASVGILFAPSKREKAMKSFFGGEEKWVSEKGKCKNYRAQLKRFGKST